METPMPLVKLSKAIPRKEKGTAMFYDVRIFDAKGRLKRTVSSEKHHKQHWKKFIDLQFNPKTPLNGRSGVSKRMVRAKIRQAFPELYSSEGDLT
jgi:hypothetical protein